MNSENNVNRFLDHDLSEQEEAVFLDQLKNDDQLNNEVNFIKEVNESITDDEVYFLRQKLSILISNAHKGISIKKLVFSVAASVALIISVLTITHSASSTKIFDAFYAPYKTDINTRSAIIEEQGMKFALKLYTENEYEAAYGVLSNYNKTNFDNISAKYFLGLCAIELNKFEEAESQLKAVVESDSFGYTLHAKWYLSMLYLKNDMEDKAIPYLEDLASNSNFYSQKASKILKKHL